MFSRPKILFLVSLLFVALLNSIPTYLLNFEFFYYSSLFTFYTCYAFIIHNNLSAGVQNVTGAYVIIMLVYRRLLTTYLPTWQCSCVIANNARNTARLFVQGYNLEVHNVIKYMRKHRATCKISCCVT